MRRLQFLFALELRDDTLRQHLAQLDAPLVERIDVPDRALREYGVLIERYQFSKGIGRQPLGQNRVGWTFALKPPGRQKPFWRALSRHFFRGFAERQCLGLRTHVRDQNVVMPADGIQRLSKRDKVA